MNKVTDECDVMSSSFITIPFEKSYLAVQVQGILFDLPICDSQVELRK